jgi:hypothetical protein
MALTGKLFYLLVRMDMVLSVWLADDAASMT